MKKNGGFSLVELIIVMACFSLVAFFFWTMISSSSEDTYTLTEKVAVQTSVTSLMNIIQKDIQEARIFYVATNKRGIMTISGDKYKFFNDEIVYTFNSSKRTVTRTEGSSVSVYGDIIEFSMKSVDGEKVGEKLGAEINILGGKKAEGVDKSRYQLNSSYYTRNTI